MDNLGILELNAEQLDDAVYKNQFIAQCQKEYLGIVNQGKLSAEQLIQIVQGEDMLTCGDVFAICAGEAQDAVQLSLENVLECFALQIVGLVFRRDLLAMSGNYNYRLDGMTDYELLCRLTEANQSAIFVFPGMDEDVFEVGVKEACTCAYIVRSFLQTLQATNKAEPVLQQMYFVMEQCAVLEAFKAELNKLLGDEAYYEKIASATAPFLVLRGGDTCHGVLQDFAECLFYGLKAAGQACVLLGQDEVDYECFMNRAVKGVVGFQAKALEIDFFKNLHGPKIQFWLDNPVFASQHFAKLSEDCYVLCHDCNYVEFIRKEYHKQNARPLPLAGHSLARKENDERPYTIVFVGGYIPESQDFSTGMDKIFYEYMLEHPHMTFEDGLTQVLTAQEIDCFELKLVQRFADLKHICQNVINHYRTRVMETILSAGYEVHVYGDSWDEYHSPNAHRLIRHPEVTVEESIREWQKAKIGLNVMSWHKAGMTERIANIMLSGAVCLSEETSYLKEHFAEDEQIVTFRLDALEELPGKIEWLLEGDRWREIAREGYEIASREHTWAQRALELVTMVENFL